MIEKLTGPLDATLAIGALSYAVVYLACQVLCEVHGFANPKLAQQRHDLARLPELEELAQIGRLALAEAAGTVERGLGELT